MTRSAKISLLALAGVWALLPADVRAGAAVPGDVPRVRVATYNVWNYLAMDRRFEGRFRPDYPKREVEKEAVRRVIREVEPDVLALQEMGPAPYLEELRQDLHREGIDFPHSHLLEAADPERHVAVLSRIPFKRVVSHPEIEFTYLGDRERVKRGMLEVDFATPGGEWTLFVVHLKSRFTDRPDDARSEERRTQEARALRNRILSRFPRPGAARFLIAGDFNDTRGSRPLAAFLRRGDTVLSEILPATDSRGESWTHRFLPEETYARVDFILVSPGMRSMIVEQRGFVHDTPDVLVGSDHRPVFLDLSLNDEGAAVPPGAASP